MTNAPTMRPHDSGRPKRERNEQGPRTAFPLLRGLSSVSTQSAPGGIRTPNLLIRNQMLYPLSYGRRPRPGIPGAQRRERLPVHPAQTEIRPPPSRLPTWLSTGTPTGSWRVSH